LHIYIDESGSFVVLDGRKSRIACIAALVIPSHVSAEIFSRYESLRAGWNLEAPEVKGSSLNEVQVSTVAELLSEYDPLLLVAATDMGHHTEKAVCRFRERQAQNVRNMVDSGKHHPNLVRQVLEMADGMDALSTPLFIQLMLTWELCEQILRVAQLYYVQRQPSELSEFVWRIDAKDKSLTRYERLWTDLLYPQLMATFLSDPLISIEGADYSFARHYDVSEEDLAAALGWVPAMMEGDGVDKPFDLRKVMANREFGDSRLDTGLQLADICASAFTRAINKTLRRDGWSGLGRLMLRETRGRPMLLRLQAGTTDRVDRETELVLNDWMAVSKKLFLERDEFLKRVDR
jgi:hypothetical protein